MLFFAAKPRKILKIPALKTGGSLKMKIHLPNFGMTCKMDDLVIILSLLPKSTEKNGILRDTSVSNSEKNKRQIRDGSTGKTRKIRRQQYWNFCYVSY